jgi:prepilin-type N-terminal cleavage/methylation domain-containing protein
MARRRRGFSLIELIAVIVILSALAVSAAPAIRSVGTAREGSMSRHLVRLVGIARAHASATGQPTGLIYDSGAGSFLLRRIATDSAAPTPVPNPLGVSYPDLILAVEYPAVTVTGFTTGDGDPLHSAIWFSFDGTPEIRDAAGVLVSSFTQDAVITTSGAKAVTIRMTTGTIE